MSEIKKGHLEAARSAGAHDEFIAFVAEYPESGVAGTLETAISLDALDEFEGFGGSFEVALWKHGVKKAGNPDKKNQERIEALFDKDRWPTWMQQRADEEQEAEA